MAHFAEIGPNNIVTRVLSVPDSEQHRGQEYLADNVGLGGTWVQTSYNHNIRKNFAGVGYIYNEELDIFLPPKPYTSWIIDAEKGEWTAPTPRPEEQQGKAHIWIEETQEWRTEDLPEAIILP
jgi:hypothetical protein